MSDGEQEKISKELLKAPLIRPKYGSLKCTLIFCSRQANSSDRSSILALFD